MLAAIPAPSWLADLLRYTTLMLGAGIFGAHVATYWRIGRYAVPPSATRAILASAGIITLFAMLEVVDHLGHPLTWRTPVVFTGFIAHYVGMVKFYRWTFRPEGRKVRHQLIAETQARRLLLREGLKP